MSDASEFGGKTNALGIQPHPHQPTAAEKLRAVYVTGDPLMGGDLPPQSNREAFHGLLPEAEQRALRESEGALRKGEVWEAIEQAGGA